MNLKHANDRFNYSKVAQIIFQDPYASLDPRMTVSSIIEEGMVIHNMYDDKRRKERVFRAAGMVGLNREHANRLFSQNLVLLVTIGLTITALVLVFLEPLPCCWGRRRKRWATPCRICGDWPPLPPASSCRIIWRS